MTLLAEQQQTEKGVCATQYEFKIIPYGRIHSSLRCFWPAHTCRRSSASTPEQQYCTLPSRAPIESRQNPTYVVKGPVCKIQ